MSKVLPTCAGADDPRCLDLEFAADHLDICPDASAITGLRISPLAGEVEVNSKYPFSAYLTFADGREKNVTDKAAWSSSNTNIADVDTGVCTGRNIGVVTVEATYRQLFDFSQLTVIAQCFQVGMDIILLFDRSASMTIAQPDGTSRIAACQAAAKAFVANCIFQKDQAAVISFGGIYETAADGAITRMPDTTTHLVLGSSIADVQSAIDSVAVRLPCLYTLPDDGQGTRCATGIGGGLQAAKDELASARARTGVRKVIVLLTDGLENICTPNPVVLATELKALNVLIVVVALNLPNALTVVCGTKVLAHDYLKSLVACDLFFAADDAGELVDIYARIPSIICKNQAQPCMYYLAPPTANPSVPIHPRDVFHYTGLKNWTIDVGDASLIGVETWPTLAAGRGLVLRLGATPPGPLDPRPANEQPAAMHTKRHFTFGQGSYRLSVAIRGNGMEAGTTDRVTLHIGGGSSVPALHEMVDLAADHENVTGWREFVWTFSPSIQISASIQVFINHFGKGWYIGPMFDAFKLENIDTGDILFEDNFDTENT